MRSIPVWNAQYTSAIVILILDDRGKLAIHAMKARPQYFGLLP